METPGPTTDRLQASALGLTEEQLGVARLLLAGVAMAVLLKHEDKTRLLTTAMVEPWANDVARRSALVANGLISHLSKKDGAS